MQWIILVNILFLSSLVKNRPICQDESLHLVQEENDWIFPGDRYNEEFKNWRGYAHNGQFRSQTLQYNRKTEQTCYKYAGSDKFNGIPREVKPSIPIKSYKDQRHEHIIRNVMWDVSYLPDPRNKEKKWDLLIHQKGS